MKKYRNTQSNSYHLRLPKHTNQKTNNILGRNNFRKKVIVLYLSIILSVGAFLPSVVSNEMDPWWNPEWNYRKQITIDHTKVLANLMNFTVLIHITEIDLALKTQTNGNDIVFTDKLGNKLNHEIEYYNKTTGELIAWVKIPLLSSIDNTALYLYYGNQNCDTQQNPEGTWDSNYLAVHHLDEISGTVYDSTLNNNDGTPFGGLNQNIPGYVDGADYFDGVNDHLTLPRVFSSQNQFTFEAWIYPQVGSRYIISQWNNYQGSFLQVGSTPNHIEWYIDGTVVGGAYGMTLDSWYHIVASYDGVTARIYANAGTPVNKVCSAPTWPAEGLVIGDRLTGGRPFHGVIDEVRLSNIARDSAWIRTEYNNQLNPSSFYGVGLEEYSSVAPVVTNEDPINGATDISVYTSQLTFLLSDLQEDPMSYTVIAVPDIIGGPQNGIGVNSGEIITIPIIENPIEYGTLYTWHVNVSDGIHWTNETFSFTTESLPTFWQFRKEITINHTKVSSNLINFSVLIHITDSDLALKAQPTGNDICFTDEARNKLNHEIEYYNRTTGELIAWVNVPALSSTEDTILYLCYGNPACPNQENVEGTWDSHYLAVHHLDELSGTVYDSTSYNNDGTPIGGLNQNILGYVDGADYFDGVNDRLTLPRVFSLQNQFTFEAWIYPQVGSRYIISQWNNYQGSFLQVGTTPNRIEWYIDSTGGSISGITLDTWYHIVLTYNGVTARIYANAGTPVNKVCSAPTWPAEGLVIGDRLTGGRAFHGRIDEVRLSNIARDSAWIQTEYNNQQNPSSFYNIGNEEYTSAAPIISDENPENGVTNIPTYLTTLQFDLTDYQDDNMNYTVTTVPDIINGPQNGSNISSGTRVSIPIIDLPLEYETEYTWLVHVNDGIYWTNTTYTFTTIENIQPVISDVYPHNQNAPYNPRLTANISDQNNDFLTIIFKTNVSGTWTVLQTYYGYNGKYSQDATQMNSKNTRYYWSLSVSDGSTWVNNTYTFIAQPFVLKWQYDMNTTIRRGPEACDVDHDGIYEVFAIGTGKISCFNGKTGAMKWSYAYPSIGYESQFEIGDLNNDGFEEIVISVGNRTLALHANNGTVYWNVRAASTNKNIIIADLDGNKYPYVFIAADDVNHGANGTGRIRKLRGTDGAVLAETFVWRPCYGSLSFADLENDGKFEICMTDRSYDYHDGEFGKGIQCYDAETLELLWYQDIVLCSSQSAPIVDVNNDGILDVVVIRQRSNESGIYVIDGATWEKMPGKWQDRISLDSEGNPIYLSAHSQISIHDIDLDGNLELITCSDGPPKIWDLGRWDVENATLAFACEPPLMGNVMGDEKLEIIDALNRVYIYNQTYQLVETINTPALAHTLVQDLDNNGRNELVLVGLGKVTVYDTSGVAPATLPRTNSRFYSERRTGAAIYIPLPGAPQPIIKQISPQNRTQDVTINPLLCAHIVDYHYDLMNITFSTNASGIWTDIASFNEVGNGWYNISTTSMSQSSTTYYWRITATDPYADKKTTIQTYSFTTSTSPSISNIIAPTMVTPGQPINISCRVTDNDLVNFVTINITAPDGHSTNTTTKIIQSGWVNLRYDDFEAGWGSYTDGGPDNDCIRSSSAGYAHHGTYSVRIRDYNGTDSSFYLTSGINGLLNRYAQLKIDFWFKTDNMGDLENFWVKYWDGKHWRIADNYIKPGDLGSLPGDKPFNNGQFYHAITWINNTRFLFHNDMKIKFECDANSDDDHIFIDQVYINATTGLPSRYYLDTIFTQQGTYQYYIWAVDNHGNSIRSDLHTIGVGPQYTLTTSTNGTGSGTITIRPSAPYFYGDVVTLWANASQGSTFTEWSGNLTGTTTPQTLIMNSNKTANAQFTLNGPYTLTTTTGGNGTGTINVTPNGPYYYGAMVTLWANASEGSAFTGWSGNLSGYENPTTLMMDANKTVNAEFTQGLYTVTVHVDPVTSGTVTKTPDQIAYNLSQIVQLTAIPSEDWQFDHWSGDLNSTTNPDNVTVTKNMDITAHFILINYNDTVFNSSFEMGNLKHVQYQSGDHSGYRYYTATLNYSTVSFADKHWWFYYSMENTIGKTITLQLQNLAPDDFQPGDLSRMGNIEPVYSYNNIDWERLPLENVSVDSINYTFTMTIAPTQNKIWLAPIPPYTTAMRDALFTEFSASPYLTISSLGTTPLGQEIKVATITNSSVNNATKFRAYVIAQQHAGETPGSWNTEGMIRFLLSDDPMAQAIRQNYIFRIIPIVNVEGVYYGVGRYTPFRSGVQYDLNRWWDAGNYPNAPFEVKRVYEDIQTWQPDCFNDLHSTVTTEVGSSREVLTYTWSTTDATILAFRTCLRQGGWPETVTGVTGYACAQLKNRQGLIPTVSFENPLDETSTNPGVKLTVNDWMNWGIGYAKGVSLFFGTNQPFLVDPTFDTSVDSADLRANSTSQDWYESRGGFSGGDSTLLTLNTTMIGGNNGKKVALKNYGILSSAYLTQEFSTILSKPFTVSYNIYIDRIQDNANYDRTGHLFIGDNRVGTNAPTGESNERYVCLAFYDSTPGDTGSDIQIRVRTTSGQSWSTTSQWIQVTTGLSYDTWYTLKVVVNPASGTYNVYLNGVLAQANIPKYNGYTPTTVKYFICAADSDARGDFYVDNVYSPAVH